VVTPIVFTPTGLTPVENRNGRLYKREDLHRDPESGINGSKYRVARHLFHRAVMDGATKVVSASSVLSPQAAMAGVLADQFGIDCELFFGATTPELAVKHDSVRIAVEHGAIINAEKRRPAYNNSIQKAAARAALQPGVWQLPYGITPPAGAPREAVQAFLAVNGEQVRNLPPETETLVMTLGSGNTAAGVLQGLYTHGSPLALKRLVLVGVGPDRLQWMWDRLEYSLGNRPGTSFRGLDIVHMPLHGWFAEYGDKMPETTDGIVLHPTYEGKLARYLNELQPEWWTRRDGTTCFWIVGGPFA
jgi:hypothetical protein